MTRWRCVYERDGSVSPYAKRLGAYRICRVVVMGVESFEVWHGQEFVKAYKDAAKATAAVERRAA